MTSMLAPSRSATRGLVWLLALGWLAVTLLPIAFMLLTSLKSQQDMFSGSLWAWPERFD